MEVTAMSQGDREGRPYNTKLPVFHVNVYCRGDPRGRPGSQIVALAIIHRPCPDGWRIVRLDNPGNHCYDIAA